MSARALFARLLRVASIAEVGTTVILSDIAARFVPLDRIRPLLDGQARDCNEASAAQMLRAQRVGSDVRGVCRRLPYQPACLAQAIAARLLLRRRGIDSVMWLGVRRTEPTHTSRDLAAHAWVDVGGTVIVGGDHSGYTGIASFPATALC